MTEAGEVGGAGADGLQVGSSAASACSATRAPPTGRPQKMGLTPDQWARDQHAETGVIIPLPLSVTPLARDDAAAGGESEGEEEWQVTTFILLLDSPQYDDELRALIEWVEVVLVPGYLAEPSADARRCHMWFEHPVAIARLHALWLAWQELTEPATCSCTAWNHAES
ncbi:DUF4913 domain-containing protein [Streptomyces sp. NPDC058579]|uniref:DUF4913 domain-containing protein n=1 Tax=Streptomyces sp. NPDC058579 TaxID=3346548 RepID=UPI0036606AEC